MFQCTLPNDWKGGPSSGIKLGLQDDFNFSVQDLSKSNETGQKTSKCPHGRRQAKYKFNLWFI